MANGSPEHDWCKSFSVKLRNAVFVFLFSFLYHQEDDPVSVVERVAEGTGGGAEWLQTGRR